MKNVTITPKGSCWYVFADNEFIGRYTTAEATQKIAQLVRESEHWPPKSPEVGIWFERGRWRAYCGGHEKTFYSLEDAKAAREQATRTNRAKTSTVRRETKADQKACAKCKWSGKRTTSTGTTYTCDYCLRDGHGSRVKMHYERTGRESLEGFTFGADCTEFERRDGENDRRKPVRIRL